MNNFDKLVEETKDEIRKLLKNSNLRPNYMTHEQLSDVQSELCKMVLIRNPEKFYPYYPKGMVDACWSPDDPLVVKLNLIADMYMNGDLCKEN